MPRPNQRVISLPKDLVDEVEAYVQGHRDKGYTSIADFMRSAAREKLGKVQGANFVSVRSDELDRWQVAIDEHPEWKITSIEDFVNRVLLSVVKAFETGRYALSGSSAEAEVKGGREHRKKSSRKH